MTMDIEPGPSQTVYRDGYSDLMAPPPDDDNGGRNRERVGAEYEDLVRFKGPTPGRTTWAKGCGCETLCKAAREENERRQGCEQGGRFVLQKQGTGPMYQRQYSQVYFMRLRLLHKVLLERVRQRWPGTPVVKILEVGKNEGLDCAVIGTVYKEMKLKPSILQEYQKASALQRLMAPATSFCSADDKLVLEDEGARMKLEAAAPSTSAADGAPATGLPVQSLVTGVVVAVRGSHSPNGTFQVTDLCYAGWAPQPERPRPQPGSASKTVALLSGLAVSNSQQQRLRIDVLCDYLRGMLGRDVDAEDSSSICRLVVAGGLLKGSVDSLATATPMSREQRSSLLPVQDADMLLAELCSGLPVTLMPGPGDPANVSLPQQPLHRCLLEGAAAFRSLHRTTNPHEFALDGVRILGCSGQNLEDVLRSSHQESRLEAARSLLLDHRHLAPTAPDTLPCFPYNDQDPFVLHHLPHVFFIANQPRFETALYEGPEGQVVRVVLVPSFDTTGELVLVNLDSLEASTMQFECSF